MSGDTQKQQQIQDKIKLIQAKLTQETRQYEQTAAIVQQGAQPSFQGPAPTNQFASFPPTAPAFPQGAGFPAQTQNSQWTVVSDNTQASGGWQNVQSAAGGTVAATNETRLPSS